MVKFRLCIQGMEEEDEGEFFVDSFMIRTFKMPSLPRKGEYIRLCGSDHTIDDVQHNLDKGIAEVRIINLSLIELCEVFIKYKGWKFEGFSPSQKRIFKKVVKERRKIKAKK